MRLLLIFFVAAVMFGCTDNVNSAKPNVNTANSNTAKPAAAAG